MSVHGSAPDRRRRFYKAVEVTQADDGWSPTLDGRTPRSPQGQPLVLPTETLARLAAAEWDAQDPEINPDTMPVTRLAWAALSLGASDAADRIAEYAGSDLLCYFAERPASLVARQQAEWGPLLEWAETALGVDFRRAVGVQHIAQRADTIAAVRATVAAEEPFALTGLVVATALFGSAILALALRRARIDGAGAYALSRLDESFQEERWGVDAEAAARAARILAEAEVLERWFKGLAG
ncbi:MAG TPA: ATP12 family protein [Caulobacteraceae bacterium]